MAKARENAFEISPCQAPEVKKRFPMIEQAACMKAMHLVLPDGTLRSGAQAIPEIVKRLKRFSSLAGLFQLPGAEVMARALYRWFAARRYHVSELLVPKPPHSGRCGRRRAEASAKAGERSSGSRCTHRRDEMGKDWRRRV